MTHQPLNLKEKLSKITDHWSPKVFAEMNDYQFKLVKIHGDFVWHQHNETDEVFFVIDGEMKIEFRDSEVTLRKGELYVVPKGVEHKPFADNECHIMLVEPKGVVNTGEAGGDLTADNDEWV
ncbi:cupin domain-containing protein [Bacillus sp. P14.5]|uniref:cupin domain-containing protein n=1 Tax=Bacillus sp. P14.5 TaxID=1983400 RepID=UPI000DE9050A|nr:cupin domain-containing protein [Bacillus sp. P14.5]